jgi:SAM-dependent methyltransferase
MRTRRAVALGAERLGLGRPAFTMWEWGLAARALPELVLPSRRQASDGLPLPPPILRVRVTGTADRDEFVAQSSRAADTVRDVVRLAGREFEALDAVLDFGCGCGRVMRKWANVPGPSFFGSDYNSDLIKWCRQNLPYARFEVNRLAPPLPFAADQFDLVYAFSVFTHLTELLQHEWMAELRRIVRPRGLLVFSTRGAAWAWKLTPDERSRYERGDLVVRYGDVAGTNLCAAFHPWPYIREQLARSFTFKESLPGRLADGAQDVHVVERTA